MKLKWLCWQNLWLKSSGSSEFLAYSSNILIQANNPWRTSVQDELHCTRKSHSKVSPLQREGNLTSMKNSHSIFSVSQLLISLKGKPVFIFHNNSFGKLSSHLEDSELSFVYIEQKSNKITKEVFSPSQYNCKSICKSLALQNSIKNTYYCPAYSANCLSLFFKFMPHCYLTWIQPRNLTIFLKIQKQ